MNQSENRFTLEKYKTPASRHTCPSCGKRKEFARYIDTDEMIVFPDHVGKCNREINCGYHFKPKQYFKQAGIKFERPDSGSRPNTYHPPSPAPAPPPPSYIAESDVTPTIGKYQVNNFAKFVFAKFGQEVTERVLMRYGVGTSRHWNNAGATIFWQRDISGKVRSGKVMLYNPSTGKRVKDDLYKPTWVHKVHPILKRSEFNLSQCFFGEHLLKEYPSRPVAIVESEKTAILASIYFSGKNLVWLAIGGKSLPSIERWQVLKDRRIVLFPDTGRPKGTDKRTPFEQWSAKAEELTKAGFFVKVSNLLEQKATIQEHEDGADIADYLLKCNLKEFEKAPTKAPERPTAPPAPSALPPGYHRETYTVKATGEQIERIINADGYPAAWDIKPPQSETLARMIKAAPAITNLISCFDLKPDPEGWQMSWEQSEKAWQEKRDRAKRWFPAAYGLPTPQKYKPIRKP